MLKELFKFLERVQNNVPALISVVAIAAICLSGFALFVVLMIVKRG